jgi:hypothetical protein
MNTQSCDCRKVSGYDEVERPGDFYFHRVSSQAFTRIYLQLPDGSFNALPVYRQGDLKPEATAWLWDGNESSPTLSPSIHCIDHWHGFLRSGRLVSC